MGREVRLLRARSGLTQPAVWGAAAIGAFGIWTELRTADLHDWAHWSVDVVVGFTFLAAGLAVDPRARRVGIVLAATAAAWFVGNIAPVALFLHRGPLLVLVWTYPTVRLGTRRGALALAGAAALVVPALARTDAGTVLFGGVAGLGAVRVGRNAHGVRRRTRRAAFAAGTTVAAGAIGAVVLRQVTRDGVELDFAAVWYGAMLAAAAVPWVDGVRPRAADAIADVVVELTAGPERPLRARLGDLLDDPGLLVASRVGDEWVDDRGAPVTAASSHDRVLSEIPGVRPRVAIVHDQSLARDPALMSALQSVAILASRNTELDAAMQRSLNDLGAARRRLIDVEAEERERLSTRLRRGVGEHLDAIDAALAAALAAIAVISVDPALIEAIEQAGEQLRRTQGEVADIAAGLHPDHVRSDLLSALASLTSGSPIPVEIQVLGEVPPELDGATALALYFSCAEALTNALKHAEATRVDVGLEIDRGVARLTVADDGVGGADSARGTGLLGVRDRVAAAGGELALRSTDAGTTVAVTLPIAPIPVP